MQTKFPSRIADQRLPAIQPNWALFFNMDSEIEDELPSHIAILLRHKLSNAVTNIRSLGVRTTENLHVLQGLVPKFDELQQHYPLLKIENKGNSIAVDYSARPFLRRMVINYLKLLTLPCTGILRFQEQKMTACITLEKCNNILILNKYMQYSPFAGRVPVLISDHVSIHDSDAINQMGGITISLGHCPANAMYQCRDMKALRLWIKESISYSTQMVLVEAANRAGEQDARIC